MKKKILAFILSATMVVGLAACGSSNTNTENGNSEAVESTTSDSSSQKEDTEETIKTKLLVWSPSEDQSAEQGAWLQTMCEAFNAEHPEWEITFEYGVCAEGDAKATVTQDVEAAADVYMFANDNLNALIAANAISRIGGETAEYIKANNSEAIVDSVSVDGSIYGVPFTTNTWFMYYDKSVFTEEEASNLDTMLEKGKVSFPLDNSWYIASFYIANGCTLFGNTMDEEAGIDFGGDKAVDVTEYLVDLVANPNFVNDAVGAGIAGLRDGSIGAIFSGSWDANNVKEILGDNFGAISLPTITINGEEKQMMSFAGSKALAVNPNTEYPQIAVALAKYLADPEAQKLHYELRSVVPCNTELNSDPEIAADALVQAQNNTFANTSIIQPFVSKMDNYWLPAENFGKSLISKEITKTNMESKTEELNASLNSSLAE